MGDVVCLTPKKAGATATSADRTAAPLRSTALYLEAGEPEQCERLGVVVDRVLDGLIVSRPDIIFTDS